MARWYKTPGDPKNCIEVGQTDYGDFSIRQSQFRARTVVVTRQQLEAFLNAAKWGHFDHLLERPK